jgi:hypothetical protein
MNLETLNATEQATLAALLGKLQPVSAPTQRRRRRLQACPMGKRGSNGGAWAVRGPAHGVLLDAFNDNTNLGRSVFGNRPRHDRVNLAVLPCNKGAGLVSPPVGCMPAAEVRPSPDRLTIWSGETDCDIDGGVAHARQGHPRGCRGPGKPRKNDTTRTAGPGDTVRAYVA